MSRRRASFRDAYLSSERAWLQDASPSRAELKAVRAVVRVPMGILAALALSLVVGFFVPFPRVVNAPATLKPTAVVAVAAPARRGPWSRSRWSRVSACRAATCCTPMRGGRLHAPISGVVSNVLVSVGRPTQRGQHAATVEDQSRLMMTVRLTGKRLERGAAGPDGDADAGRQELEDAARRRPRRRSARPRRQPQRRGRARHGEGRHRGRSGFAVSAACGKPCALLRQLEQRRGAHAAADAHRHHAALAAAPGQLSQQRAGQAGARRRPVGGRARWLRRWGSPSSCRAPARECSRPTARRTPR